MRRPPVAAVLAALAFAAVAGRADALSGDRLRVGDHPAFVRVVLDVSGGALTFNTVMSVDPDPRDGVARIEIDRPGIASSAAPADGFGVGAVASAAGGKLTVRLTAARSRFKYLSYFLLAGPQRLVIDLWKGASPPAARYTPNRCLSIGSHSLGGGVARAAGTERFLFEHSLVVVLRGPRGGLVTERPEVAVNGRWSSRLAYTGPRRRGTLEAASFSAKDGALDCLVQVPVTLLP
jgi:hypothetical protein